MITTTGQLSGQAVAYLGGPRARPSLWPDRRDFFKDELSRLRTAKVSQVTEVYRRPQQA